MCWLKSNISFIIKTLDFDINNESSVKCVFIKQISKQTVFKYRVIKMAFFYQKHPQNNAFLISGEKFSTPHPPPPTFICQKSSSPPCSIHNECSVKNLMHDDFTCVFSIPVKFEICFLGLPKDLFFGVISYNLLHFIALEKCRKECDMT